MTRYVLKPEVVRDCLHRLIDAPIHRMFPGYLCLQQQSGLDNRKTGLSFPYNEFFDDYLRVGEDDSDKPYFVPFNSHRYVESNSSRISWQKLRRLNAVVFSRA